MTDCGEQRGFAVSLFFAATQCLSIHSKRAEPAGWRGFLQDTFCPFTYWGLKGFFVQMPEDGVQGSHRRGFAILKPQSLG